MAEALNKDGVAELLLKHIKLTKCDDISNMVNSVQKRFSEVGEEILYKIQKNISFLFIQKYNIYPTEKINFQKEYVEPIVSVPIEVFAKPKPENIIEFLKGLNKHDILLVEIVDNSHYTQINNCKGTIKLLKARAIAKIDETHTFAYHLNAPIYLFEVEESKRLGEIPVSQILKIVVLGNNPYLKMCFATCNPVCAKNPEIGSTLGFVDPKDMPFDLRAIKCAMAFPSYVQYLRSHPNFHQVHYLKEDIKSLGIDLYHSYSFIDKIDNLEYSPDQYVDALEERAKQDLHFDSMQHLQLACKYAESKEYNNALEEFEESIKLWPKNPKVFERRGIMFCNMMTKNDKSYREKAMNDFETTLKLFPGASEAKTEYSKLLVDAAKYYYKVKKDFNRANQINDLALDLVKNSEQGKKLKERIQKKMKTREEIKELERKKKEIQQIIKLERF